MWADKFISARLSKPQPVSHVDSIWEGHDVKPSAEKDDLQLTAELEEHMREKLNVMRARENARDDLLEALASEVILHSQRPGPLQEALHRYKQLRERKT